jgi:hypothetical protein
MQRIIKTYIVLDFYATSYVTNSYGWQSALGVGYVYGSMDGSGTGDGIDHGDNEGAGLGCNILCAEIDGNGISN